MANRDGLRLLIFDDGGPSTISQLIALQKLMKKVSSMRRGGIEVKPCKYFDIIVGTGTGGLVAVMLVKLRMSVDETIKELEKICKEVYMKTDYTPAERTSKLRECIENLLSRKKIPIDAKMCDEADEDSCRSFIVARPQSNPSGIIKLRTYATRNEVPQDATIIEATLATCAIEPVFLPVMIAPIGKIIGGGLGINLINEVLKDIQSVFGGEATIGSLVSLGAGHPSLNSLSNDGYSGSMEKILSDNEEAAKKAEQQFGPLGFYFRFSSPQEIQSESNPESQLITSNASAHIEKLSTPSKLDQCAMVLESRLGLVAVDQLLGTFSAWKSLKGLPSLTMHFVMRDEPWKELTRGLIRTEEQSSNQNIVVVSGMGGCGKTQLVIKFAKEHKSMYEYVFWVDGSSEATIKADLTSHVRSLGGDHSQTDWAGALEFLASHSAQWLIVYDNVDDINIKLAHLLPDCDHGSVIITTRNRALGQLASEVHLELDVMTRDEANETILRSAKMKITDENKQEIGPVAEALGLLPVALVQAGSYMFQTKCSPGEYISLLQCNRSELLKTPAAAQRDVHHRGAYTAFDVSYQAVPSHIQKFLHLLSFYHHADFPLAMIPHAAKQAFKTARHNLVDNDPLFNSATRLLDEIFCPSGVWKDTNLHKMLMILQSYSFATFGPRLTTLALRMHPLIHSFSFDRLRPEEREVYAAAAVRLMGCWGGVGVEAAEIHNVIDQWGLIHHMEAVFSHVKEISINDRATIATISYRYGDRVHIVQIWEEILEVLQDKYGPVNLHLAEVCIQLGWACWLDTPKSCEALARAVSIREQLLGPCHEETLDARINLAQAHINGGDYGVAEKLLEKLQMDTPEDSAVMESLMVELGKLYVRRGQYTKAEGIQRQYLELMKKQHGDEDLRTISAMELLSDTYIPSGQYLKAEELLLRVKDFNEAKPQGSSWFEGHRYLLPITYRAQGKYDKAEAMQTQQINILEELNHSNSIMATRIYSRDVHSRGETYYCQGRYAEAEQACLHALSILKESLAPDHPMIMQPKSILGRIYHALGRYSEAEALQLEMVERRLKFHEGIHPHVLRAYADLACTYAAQGRLDEAKERQEWVLEQRKEWLGENHPDTGSAMYDLGATYQRLGRIRKARDLVMKAESVHATSLGTNHPQYYKTLDLLKELQKWHLIFVYYGDKLFSYWKESRLKEAVFMLILAVLVYFATSAWLCLLPLVPSLRLVII